VQFAALNDGAGRLFAEPLEIPFSFESKTKTSARAGSILIQSIRCQVVWSCSQRLVRGSERLVGACGIQRSRCVSDALNFRHPCTAFWSVA
jgi:hypothetical protein